jgi:hypothetical protein
VSAATRPIEPDERAGVWPRPRLSRRATALGLNRTQWGYVLAGYTLWDGALTLWSATLRPLAVPAPWTTDRGEAIWALACLFLTAGLVGFTFHGLHAYRAWQRAWPYWGQRTPALSVWRPVEASFDEAGTEEAAEEHREHDRRTQAHRASVAFAGNPLGWVVD